MASTISAGTTAGTAIAVAGDTTGNLAFQTNGTTTAMTITTAQNVGIGTTTPFSANGTNIEVANATVSRLVLNQTGTRRMSLGVGSNAFNIYDETADAERLRIDSSGNLLFNSGYGSAAVAYGCRAWVNFNGTGTPAIRASGNVSSITDNGTGDFNVNFTTAMPDADYSLGGAGQLDTQNNDANAPIIGIRRASGALATTSARITCVSSAVAAQDSLTICVNFFR